MRILSCQTIHANHESYRLTLGVSWSAYSINLCDLAASNATSWLLQSVFESSSVGTDGEDGSTVGDRARHEALRGVEAVDHRCHGTNLEGRASAATDGGVRAPGPAAGPLPAPAPAALPPAVAGELPDERDHPVQHLAAATVTAADRRVLQPAARPRGHAAVVEVR